LRYLINKVVFNQNFSKMKRMFFVLLAVGLMGTACKKEEPEIFERPLFYHTYTDYVGSNTDSYVQVGDSTYYFLHIEGGYYAYRGRINKNCFYFRLSPENYSQNSILVSIDTKIITPEVFFQKSTIEIDSIHILNARLMDGGAYRVEYYATRSAFTWDYASYENRTFKGKGSLEIKDTLYINYPDTVYYPPQKIEFEFK